MKMIRFSLATLAVTLFVLMLAGCSEEQKDSLARVTEAGEISFAMSGGYPPFNFYNDNNELVGFDVDVANEVAARIGVKLKPVTTEWSGIIEGLRSGAYDGILGSMAVTEQRLQVVNFSTPYYYSGAQLLVKKDAPYSTPTQLKGKTIGVVTGTTFAQDAEKLGAGDVKLYKDDTHTLTELNSGVVDGVITDRVVGVNAMNSGKFDITLLGMPLRGEDIAVAFRKGDDSLLKKVNEVLTSMHQDGTLTKLSQKWLNTDITVQ
ncbi:ABC transporter substrate-binding protein [Pseudodesulfovibrio sp. zrk46]|uniref:ABC transporter substrate-binding protein n=1 Tax=Pseudodesulfovibrio sp. zrk46 TaxID=2725288 RepID=UPI001449EB8A|nr:ABC transporter substrate-binding protein [Pseudodesulfovibrio sp. zrk46]QJB56643.1 transporter substrate-binding domain-containing protein [Pseudodesulfovibrio sp. zrk46]